MLPFLAFFLFIAQTALLPPPIPPTEKLSHHTVHGHHHDHPTPSPSPQIRITIVNATSVPTIALSTSGTNLPATYPDFPQGEWTANEALSTPEIHYLVRETNGAIIARQTIRLKPISSQFLLLTGDLSRKGPSEKLPQLGYVQDEQGTNNSPNFQFHLLPYTVVCGDPCHYRIFNAMPGKTLILKSLPRDGKPSRELALLAPGNSVLLTGQPESVDYDAEIDGQTCRLSIHQEGAAGNCLIPFFLREGKPDYVRVFEEP